MSADPVDPTSAPPTSSMNPAEASNGLESWLWPPRTPKSFWAPWQAKSSPTTTRITA